MQNITFINTNTVTALSHNSINGFHYKSLSGLLSIVLTSTLCFVSVKGIICDISVVRSLKTAASILYILTSRWETKTEGRILDLIHMLAIFLWSYLRVGSLNANVMLSCFAINVLRWCVENKNHLDDWEPSSTRWWIEKIWKLETSWSFFNVKQHICLPIS